MAELDSQFQYMFRLSRFCLDIITRAFEGNLSPETSLGTKHGVLSALAAGRLL